MKLREGVFDGQTSKQEKVVPVEVWRVEELWMMTDGGSTWRRGTAGQGAPCSSTNIPALQERRGNTMVSPIMAILPPLLQIN